MRSGARGVTMTSSLVVIPFTREFPHRAEDVYAWLTDYTDEDPGLTDAILRKRRVIERHADRVVMEVENHVAGRPIRGRAEVRLFPRELRYEARSLEGDGGAILYTYQLTAVASDRTRLDVRYGTRVRKASRRWRMALARPIIHWHLRRMWSGFAAAMARDLGR